MRNLYKHNPVKNIDIRLSFVWLWPLSQSRTSFNPSDVPLVWQLPRLSNVTLRCVDSFHLSKKKTHNTLHQLPNMCIIHRMNCKGLIRNMGYTCVWNTIHACKIFCKLSGSRHTVSFSSDDVFINFYQWIDVFLLFHTVSANFPLPHYIYHGPKIGFLILATKCMIDLLSICLNSAA